MLPRVSLALRRASASQPRFSRAGTSDQVRSARIALPRSTEVASRLRRTSGSAIKKEMDAHRALEPRPPDLGTSCSSCRRTAAGLDRARVRPRLFAVERHGRELPRSCLAAPTPEVNYSAATALAPGAPRLTCVGNEICIANPHERPQVADKRPPCSSTMVRQIDNPMPIPLGLVV